MLEILFEHSATVWASVISVGGIIVGWLSRGISTDMSQTAAIDSLKEKADTLKEKQDEHGKRLTVLESDFKTIQREIVSVLEAQERQEDKADLIHEHTKEKLSAIDKRFDGIDESIGKLVDKHDSGNSAILKELRKLNR